MIAVEMGSVTTEFACVIKISMALLALAVRTETIFTPTLSDSDYSKT